MSISTDQKPCAALALLGTEQQIRHGKKRRVTKGIIIDWRYGTSIVESMRAPEDGSPGISYPSFDLKIKPLDGGKALWIGPFKDNNNPQVSELWIGDVETMNRRDPSQLMRRIRVTLFGYCASEPVNSEDQSEAWDNAAAWAFEDICDVVDKHFPDAD